MSLYVVQNTVLTSGERNKRVACEGSEAAKRKAAYSAYPEELLESSSGNRHL